jgi:hypothetical protein
VRPVQALDCLVHKDKKSLAKSSAKSSENMTQWEGPGVWTRAVSGLQQHFFIWLLRNLQKGGWLGDPGLKQDDTVISWSLVALLYSTKTAVAAPGMDPMTLENRVTLSMQHYPTVTLAIFNNSLYNR